MSWINKSSTSWCIEETGAIDREGFTGCRHSPSGLEIAICSTICLRAFPRAGPQNQMPGPADDDVELWNGTRLVGRLHHQAPPK